MNRVLLRPSGQDEDVYNFILSGPNIDYDKISTSSEEFAKTFYSLTKNTDILFGDIVWISKYRPELALLILYLRLRSLSTSDQTSVWLIPYESEECSLQEVSFPISFDL